MLKNVKYFSPQAEKVRIELEGVIADSCYPSIKNGQAQYYEYEAGTPATPLTQDVTIL
jgi:hypothetical protein